MKKVNIAKNLTLQAVNREILLEEEHLKELKQRKHSYEVDD